jgi:hypothetical protein
MSRLEAPRSPHLEWRRLTRTLVVGLAPEGVVGSIEIGRRCVVTDGAGRVFGRYRDLADAEALLVLLHERGETGPLAMRAA